MNDNTQNKITTIQMKLKQVAGNALIQIPPMPRLWFFCPWKALLPMEINRLDEDKRAPPHIESCPYIYDCVFTMTYHSEPEYLACEVEGREDV